MFYCIGELPLVILNIYLETQFVGKGENMKILLHALNLYKNQ